MYKLNKFSTLEIDELTVGEEDRRLMVSTFLLCLYFWLGLVSHKICGLVFILCCCICDLCGSSVTNRHIGYASLPFSFFKICLFLCVWVFYLHGCVCTTCFPSAHSGQKRVLDPLELELRMAVSHHVGSGNWTWVLCKSIKCSWLRSFCSSLQDVHF